MSGLSSIWLMIGLIQWANKLSSCGLHVLRWKWTGYHYAHILSHQWRKLVHLHAWTRVCCKNSSKNSWIMHLYWQIHIYNGLPTICSAYKQNSVLQGKYMMLHNHNNQDDSKSSQLYFLNEVRTVTTESRVTGTISHSPFRLSHCIPLHQVITLWWSQQKQNENK